MGVAPDPFVLLNPPVGLTPASHLHLSVLEHSNTHIQIYTFEQSLGFTIGGAKTHQAPRSSMLKGFYSSTPLILTMLFVRIPR